MTTSLVLVLLITLCNGAEEAKKKRSIFEENVHGLDLGHLDLTRGGFDLRSFTFTDRAVNEHESTDGLAHAIDLGSSINRHVTITKNIGVPVPQPYPITITKNVGVPYPVHISVPFDKPYPVQVSNPYPVPVEKFIPYTVEHKVPYPVPVPVKVAVPVAVPYPKPYPAPVHQTHAIPIPQFGNIFKPGSTVSIGSGSLGYTYLGNGAYAIGSGGLGYSRVSSDFRQATKLW